MALMKCKMCGGELQISQNSGIAECEYCGSKQTVPKMDSEKKLQLFDRANFHRARKEFDKASALYENIIVDDPNEAEAYWGVCLCRYGIEYVVDPATQRRVPTCHRASFESILQDKDYLSAVGKADAIARELYIKEAEYIDSVQKGILAISAKEEPFDIFICYKESDESGDRTVDSVIAQEIYDELTEKGYKVFFSRITLEDKLGSAYEPYIFAALNTSKVMLVVATKPEHFNAVWVKNEWSRYFALIAQGKKKAVIPCFRDMSPYDMPDEFVSLQSQDVSKVGWKQDLIRGISKIISTQTQSVQPVAPPKANTATADSLLTRAFLFLEDSDWVSANEYCERVLDIDPENASAYLCKLMCELGVTQVSKLSDCNDLFDGSNNCKKAYRFGDESIRRQLDAALQEIRNRREVAYKDSVYGEALTMMNSGTSASLEKAIEKFQSILGWRDSDEQLRKCNDIVNGKKSVQTRIDNIREKEAQIGALVSERDGLGIFAGKRKKQLDEQIAELTEQLKPEKYECAALSLQYGGKKAALKMLRNLNYKDSKELIERLVGANANLDLYVADVKDTVKFGSYMHNNTTSRQPIEWIVLACDENYLFLLSKYALDSVLYNYDYQPAAWDVSFARRWLNNDFFSTAFSDYEKQFVASTKVVTPTSEYGISGGAPTVDRLFLLSVPEIDSHLTMQERQCVLTDYARVRAKGTQRNCWLTRSPAGERDRINLVKDDGTYSSGYKDEQKTKNKGVRVSIMGAGIRPAMWIKLP